MCVDRERMGVGGGGGVADGIVVWEVGNAVGCSQGRTPNRLSVTGAPDFLSFYLGFSLSSLLTVVVVLHHGTFFQRLQPCRPLVSDCCPSDP